MTELVVADRGTEWRRLKSLVLDSVSSPITKRVYNLGLDEFIARYTAEPRAGFTKATVSAWRVVLEGRGLGSVSNNVWITAVRELAVEASENGLLAPELAAGIARIVDLVGKHGRVRTIPMPTWVKNAIDAWTAAAGVMDGHLFRPVMRGDQVRGLRMSEKVVWQLLQPYAVAAGLAGIAPHDLRRSCAKMCRAAGAEFEQIQLLLGHSSVQTTERYLGTKQDLAHAPNDAINLK